MQKKRCSCGRPAKECPVWGFLHSANCVPNATHAELLDALMRKAEGRYAAIVDSSKTAWGLFLTPFRLRRRFGAKFMLVHLTRQPTGVCWSVLKKKNALAQRKGHAPPHYMLPCAWSVLGWSFANLSCELFGLVCPRQYLHLRYEDLVRFPPNALEALFARLLPGISSSFVEPDARDNRHQLHGNAVRNQRLVIGDVREDVRWESEMPPQYARIILGLSALLRWRYGY
jgi:hypothetical protein